MYNETKLRTISRDVTYRLAALSTSIPLAGFSDGIIIELSKVLIYYVVERIWLKISWGMTVDSETHLRTLVRAITYRIVATVAVSYWVGLEFALILAAIQTILYYINERVWLKIKWGKIINETN